MDALPPWTSGFGSHSGHGNPSLPGKMGRRKKAQPCMILPWERNTLLLFTFHYGNTDTGPHLTTPESGKCNFPLCQIKGNRFLGIVADSVLFNKWQMGISTHAGKNWVYGFKYYSKWRLGVLESNF